MSFSDGLGVVGVYSVYQKQQHLITLTMTLSNIIFYLKDDKLLSLSCRLFVPKLHFAFLFSKVMYYIEISLRIKWDYIQIS